MPTTLRALILEDRPEDCELMLHELRRAGFDPVWRRVDTEADYLGALSPDLDVILADYALSGYDASRARRHLAERGLDIPFIVVSGTLGDERAAAIIKEGATDYLLKDRLARLGPAITSAIEAMRQRRALRDAESRYRGLFERVPLGLFRSTPAGEIVDANPALAQMLGYPDPPALLTVSVIDIYVDPEQRSQFQTSITEQGTVRGFETQLRRRDGSVLSVRLNASRVHDAQGRVLHYEGSIEDITERKRADEVARRSAAMFRDVLESAPDAIVIADGQGRIAIVNAQAERLFGYTREELLGRPVEVLLPERVRDAHVHHRAAYYATPRTRTMGGGLELLGRRKDGSEVPVEISLSPLETDGEILVTSVIRDVTDRKRTEEALRQSEKLVAMGSLLAGVAHELNNPLSVVLGHSRLLVQSPQSQAAERATKIAASAERCARIVKNFLALARQHPPERQGVVLGEIGREAVELLAYQLRVSDVEVALDLPPDLPVLWADPHQLHQMFVNLITNAQHALSQAPPPRRLTIAARHDPSRDAVTVDVADTGAGMSPEVRSRIFEPFFTTKPPGQGTGLGLALCRGIVEGHGGTIAVESAPGRGTTFRIELAVKPPPTAAAAAPAAAAQPVRNKSILIVDDEPDVAEILADLLAVDGHRVETALNGARAIEKLRGGAYDAILSDLKMPELDGPSLYRTLAHQSHPLIQRFIFVTGDVLGEETRQFLEETGVLCVSKPFDLEQVRRALDAAFRRGDQGGSSMSSRGRTVLIADDDPEIRRLIGEYLRSNGYEVLEAENGLETVLHVERSRPNIVILDLMMPRLGGLDALKRIRPFDPEIAVVVITGASDPELKQEALALGATAVLTKPIELADLLKAVDHARRGGPAADASETREGKARGGPVSPDDALVGRVLIVDDDAEIRALLEELLHQHGYATRSTATAASAFWALMHEVPDVVLLDIWMPGLSGVEIIPAIRNVSRDVRIIMVSGVSDVELAKRALAYGAFDYVTKPVDMEYLLRSVEAAMMTKRA